MRYLPTCILGMAGVIVLCLAVGCKPSTDTSNANSPASTQAPPGVAPVPAGQTPRAVTSAVATAAQVMATNLIPPLPAPMTALCAQYKSAPAMEDRFDIIQQIGATNNAGAVAALETLFVGETDAMLRVELVNALMGFRECKPERLRFLSRAAAAGQPFEVREAAMDGLVDLADATALTVLGQLATDADPAVRQRASELRSLLAVMIDQSK